MSAEATCPVPIQTGIGFSNHVTHQSRFCSVSLLEISNFQVFEGNLCGAFDREFLASVVNCQQCNKQISTWDYLRNWRLRSRILQKQCNEAGQWCSKRGRHTVLTIEPVRLGGTYPKQFPRDYIHKKGAALLTFSSSLGIKQGDKQGDKQGVQSRCNKTWGRVSQG